MLPKFQLYINGCFEDGSDTFDSINPATGTTWATMPEAKEDDVNRAVQAAKTALHAKEWKTLTASQRGKLLYKLADLIESAAPELAKYETIDTGKIIRETESQIAYIAEYYRYYAGLADKIEGSYLSIDKLDTQTWIKREPVGVVAAIIPWNSQLFLSAVKIGPALAAGCTIVVKASEDAPAPLLAFAKLVDQAGFPPGVVNIITGFGPSCGSILTSHPDVAHVAFTGGPETAKYIIKNTAQNLAKTSLELGGKSPFIVFADADLESAVNAQLAAIFAASGQSCVAGSRLLVEHSIKEQFLGLLLDKVKSIKVGLPDCTSTEFGPLCTNRQLQHIETVVQNSIQQGAQLLIGGHPLDRDGYYYPPTILDCSMTPNADSIQKELFGPVLSVDTFHTELEAVQKANNTQFGLASGVFTNNLTRAHRMVDAIKAVWYGSIPIESFHRLHHLEVMDYQVLGEKAV